LAITDMQSLIDRRLAGYERRVARIQQLLADSPLTAFELMQRLWSPDTVMTQTYLTLSDVLAHLDLVVARGEAAENADDAVVVFHAT
jgi:hypothetical protein